MIQLRVYVKNLRGHSPRWKYQWREWSNFISWIGIIPAYLMLLFSQITCNSVIPQEDISPWKEYWSFLSLDSCDRLNYFCEQLMYSMAAKKSEIVFDQCMHTLYWPNKFHFQFITKLELTVAIQLWYPQVILICLQALTVCVLSWLKNF